MPGSGHASSRSLSHTLRPRQGQSQRVLLSRGQVSGELDFQVRLAPGSLALSPTEECGPHLSTSQAATPYCLRSHSHGPPPFLPHLVSLSPPFLQPSLRPIRTHSPIQTAPLRPEGGGGQLRVKFKQPLRPVDSPWSPTFSFLWVRPADERCEPEAAELSSRSFRII